ncbi:glycoside hydrolase family 15 protein [Rhodococcus sp. D-6]|uniref:Glycoside hydrolase family 15 protein n=1 Tax=Rhodococcus sp. D-6 TaxID=1387842 RepID=A0AAU7UXR7_9NOCA
MAGGGGGEDDAGLDRVVAADHLQECRDDERDTHQQQPLDVLGDEREIRRAIAEQAGRRQWHSAGPFETSYVQEGFGLDAPLERWKRARDEIHHEICERGYDPVRGTFTQFYGSTELDASVLLIPLVGFLPPTDDRVTSTIDAIRNELGRDGFVSRYSTTDTDHGLPRDEGQFLACSPRTTTCRRDDRSVISLRRSAASLSSARPARSLWPNGRTPWIRSTELRPSDPTPSECRVSVRSSLAAVRTACIQGVRATRMRPVFVGVCTSNELR